MQRALCFSIWGLLLATAATGCDGSSTPPWVNPDTAPDMASLGPAPEPSWPGAGSYLVSLFDDKQSLCREAPGATSFWTTNTNALAARALAYLPVPASPTTPDPTYSGAIVARLQTLKACGCNDAPAHDGLTNHHLDPVVNKGAQLPLQPRTACVRATRLVPTAGSSCTAAGSQCPGAGFDLRHEDHSAAGWVADSCQASPCTSTPDAGWDEEGIGQGAADLLALQILNRKNRGLDPTPLWQNLLGKWDGKGMRDRAAVVDGKYATAKLALFKICARVLGQPLPDGVDHKLAEAQNPQGGFRTTYDLNGQFTSDQLGSTATTAYVVLAYRKPTADF